MAQSDTPDDRRSEKIYCYPRKTQTLKANCFHHQHIIYMQSKKYKFMYEGFNRMQILHWK